ncbi:BRCA1-A complex subunit RAP80 isoform X2 [Rhineura floridana]|uniref:BRCA1-A complex subunit RAP80 isoform X2 n=1 Tax=Rhineura floridana TaxID=261503 RepID=UPI002AC85728|nr:BRCA1-A complex subunit RAP80 isoform X2 [Rhineura floridana]
MTPKGYTVGSHENNSHDPHKPPSAVERMPKKKRKTVDGPDSETQDQEEESRVLHAKFLDACIVISDSDGEQESKEEHSLQKKRTKQQLDRAKFAAKRKIAQMTEDEQFALALKMSEQEARQLNSQEEEEEELLRKAIAESLSSCQPAESSAAAAGPLLSQALVSSTQSHPAGQGDPELLAALFPSSESPCSKCSTLSPIDKTDENGQTDVTKRPLVVLTRLSQEIVESSLVSSVIVSPGKSQPFATSNENPSSPARSSSSDTIPSLEEEASITLSPTFPQRPLGTWPLAPRRLFAGRCNPSKTTGKETDKHSQNYLEADHFAGCSEAPEKVTQKHSNLDYSSRPGAELGHQFKHSKKVCLSTEPVERIELQGNAPPLCMLHRADEECQQEEERNMVHYYWGVPFCPKGVDPIKYTQVILCQLEVYQKSLKQAQRRLLLKKPFGEPVVPNSCSLRRSERGKAEEASKGDEGTDEQEGEDMDEKKDPESIAWCLSSTNGECNKNLEQNMMEGRKLEYGEEPASSSCQASQVLFADVLEEREPMQITQSISALTPLDSKRSPDMATENHAEEEITVCPETQPNPSQAIEPESGEIHSSSKDVSLQANADEDAGKAVSACSPPANEPVSCPLCDRRFPVSEIEQHAMYCKGTGEDTTEDAPVMTRRQREAKSKVSSCKESSESVDIDKYEKCYLCKALVPRKEYQRHVDGCLWSRTANGTQSGRRLRRAKKGRTEGRLLNMLEQSEHKAADTEVAAIPSRGEDTRHNLAEMDKEDEYSHDVWSPFPQADCSDSPIKSFTSISEAKDCLVDFKNQLAVGSGSRKQTKASLRSRKKF